MIDPSKRMTNLLRLGERFVEVGALPPGVL